MFGLNETTLVGRIGAEPEIRATNAVGARCVSFSVATDESYRDKTRGELVEKTEWHRIVSFMPGLVDRIEQLQKKGTLKGKLVLVRGRNRTRSYKVDGEEKERFIAEVIIDMNGIFSPLERVSDANNVAANDTNAAAPSPLPDQDNATPPVVDEATAAAM